MKEIYYDVGKINQLISKVVSKIHVYGKKYDVVLTVSGSEGIGEEIARRVNARVEYIDVKQYGKYDVVVGEVPSIKECESVVIVDREYGGWKKYSAVYDEYGRKFDVICLIMRGSGEAIYGEKVQEGVEVVWSE